MDQKQLASRRAQTAKARDAWWAKFLHDADPTGELPLARRIARAHELRDAYYRELGKLGGYPKQKRAQQVAT